MPDLCATHSALFRVTPVAMKHLDGGTSSFAVWNVTSGELYIDKR
jgi:hypothetical protein